MLDDLQGRAERLAVKHGLRDEVAVLLAQDLADQIRHAWGGTHPYFPRGHSLDLEERDRAIWQAFGRSATDTGKYNYTELAEQFNLSEYQIRARIRLFQRHIRDRQQGAGPQE